LPQPIAGVADSPLVDVQAVSREFVGAGGSSRKLVRQRDAGLARAFGGALLVSVDLVVGRYAERSVPVSWTAQHELESRLRQVRLHDSEMQRVGSVLLPLTLLEPGGPPEGILKRRGPANRVGALRVVIALLLPLVCGDDERQL